MTGHRERPIDVEPLPQTPPCPRCNRPGLLAIRVPRADSPPVGGLPPVAYHAVLCQQCHQDDHYAAPLVLFLTVHGTLEEHTVGSFAALLRRWVEHVDIPTITDARIAADIEAWHRGEFA